MARHGTWVRIVAVGATLSLLASGCSAGDTTPSVGESPVFGSPSEASASPFGSGSAASQSAAVLGPGVQAGRLIVLADGVDGGDGGMGLWALDGTSTWTVLGLTPGATAVARASGGVVVASGHDVDFRAVANLAQPGIGVAIHWPGTAPSAPIAGLDESPGGQLAVVTADEQNLGYSVVGADGTATLLNNSPTQTFTPLVRWLDDSHLLVLATDNQQASRLAVLDTAGDALDVGKGTIGISGFALSGDRQTVAAATGSAIYAGHLSDFRGPGSAQLVLTLSTAQVVWGLALDTTGTRLFTLSGTMTPDGTVGSIHELGYAQVGSTWTRVLDSPAPFTRAFGQVCLP